MPKATTNIPDIDPTFAAANNAYLALKDLDEENLAIAVAMLSQRLGIRTGVTGGLGGASVGGEKAVGPHETHGTQSPKDFLKGKKPEKEIERVACLAYFLVHSRETDSFNGKDLVALNTEARGPAFSNISVHVDNAIRAGYLTTIGGGKKGLTARGESLVEALPDREAVTAALQAHPSRGRKKKKPKK